MMTNNQPAVSGQPPQGRDYRFQTDPYQHQLDVFNKTRDEKVWALFMDMGTGKTKIVIDTFCFAWQRNLVEACCIIAPKGLYENWTDNEFPLHSPLHDRTRYLLWRSGMHKTKKGQREIDQFFKTDPTEHPPIFVINLESFSQKAPKSYTYQLLRRFLDQYATMLVVDESMFIKNHTSRCTQNVLRLAPRSKFRRILSGTPITQSPLDLYTQMHFLDPHIIGASSWQGFRSTYAILEDQYVGRDRKIQVVNGYQRLNLLMSKVQEKSTIIRKKDCLDLPPKVFEQINVEMTAQQRRRYNDMRSDAVVELQEIEQRRGTAAVTATIVLTRLIRLQQICCNFVRTDATPDFPEGQVVPVDPRSECPKMMALLEHVQTIPKDQKVLIWTNFVYPLRRIVNQLVAQFGPGSVVDYYGSTKREQRREAVRQFQDPSSPVRFFVGNPTTGGQGLTLTQGTTVFYYSNNFRLADRLQSEDRCHRIGQTQSVTYVDLIVRDSVEEKIIQALKDKTDLAATLMGKDWRQWF